jgi:hypothetical protein
MKFTVQTAFILILGALLQTFLPWWTLTIGAFAIGFLFASNGWKSFFAGFLGIGLLWLGMSLYIDITTQSVLTEKVARLFPTKTTPLLFVITSLVGGLVGGLASLTGSILTYRKPYKW